MTSSALAAPTTTASVDRDRAIATLVTAFSADPVIRWIYPDAARFLAHFPEALRLFGAPAFEAGSADWTQDHTGAALWHPPGTQSDDDGLVDLIQRSLDPDRLGDVFALLGQMEEHHPSEPCWYLPFIGVDPRYQGQGHGSRVLAQGLDRCDRDHLPAYLEASSPRNRALYERHGFTVVGEIQAGDSPPLWPMLRAPR